jgi:CheY-like chemotaxis protein
MSKILIVDDDITYRNSLKEIIEAEGHEVTECSNGNEALIEQKKNPFDIIVTDIIMPEVDGLEIIFQVKKNYPSTKIIAITGGGVFHTMDLLLMAKELGASMVLSKPFCVSMLKIQLKSLCVLQSQV